LMTESVSNWNYIMECLFEWWIFPITNCYVWDKFLITLQNVSCDISNIRNIRKDTYLDVESGCGSQLGHSKNLWEWPGWDLHTLSSFINFS